MNDIDFILSDKKWNSTTDEVAKMILDDEHLFEKVYGHFLHSTGQVAHRSGFFLGRVFKARPDWLFPRISEMLSKMDEPPHGWFTWYVVWYLSHAKFPAEHDGLAATYAFKELEKSYIKPSVKNSAMRLLEYVCKRNPELIPECKLYLEEVIANERPTLVNQAKKVTECMKKYEN